MTTQERDEVLIEIRDLLLMMAAALRGVYGSSWPAANSDGTHISASRGRRWS